MQSSGQLEQGTLAACFPTAPKPIASAIPVGRGDRVRKLFGGESARLSADCFSPWFDRECSRRGAHIFPGEKVWLERAARSSREVRRAYRGGAAEGTLFEVRRGRPLR